MIEFFMWLFHWIEMYFTDMDTFIIGSLVLLIIITKVVGEYYSYKEELKKDIK